MVSSPLGEGSAESQSNLTNGQQLLWVGQQLHPETPLYNMAFVFEIERDLDESLFAEAFSKLTEQCDALRTVIELRNGLPWQQALDSIDFELPVLDFSSESASGESFLSWAQERCETPLDITRQTFDSALVKLGAERYGWYLNQHHVVTDAWSVTVLFERLGLIYEALGRGEVGPDEPLRPYSEYLDFERRARADQEDSAHWSRFRAAPGAPAALYGRRPSRRSTRSVRVSHVLDGGRCDGLRGLAQQPDARALTVDLALFRLIVTAMFAYLHRASGETDITLGAPAHNRPTADFRQMAGLFTEVYPLRADLDENETFRSLNKKVRAETDAFLRAAKPGRSHAEINRSVSAVVNYIRAEFGTFGGAPVRTRWLHSGHVDAEHQLRLQVHDFEGSGSLTLHFDLSAEVFDGELPRFAPEHFLRLLDAMIADWDQPIAEVDLTGSAERTLVLDQTRPAPASADCSTDVMTRFERRAMEAPDDLAIECGGVRWSYGELNRKADAIASCLQSGTVVGICTSRSADSVAAMLGVLKAGAAYAPLDPAWPEERSDFVVRDAGCSVVLTDEPREFAVPSLEIKAAAASTGESPRRGPIEGGELAYILYTSGSTGRPKGVEITHGALANYVGWASGRYDRGRRLTFPLFSPLTFDLTVTSIFVPLASGGSIVVYPETGDGADLAVLDVFDDDRADIVKLTPAHLTLLQDRDLSSSRVKQLILGGEELTTPAARRIHERFRGQVVIHNEYGPTEATVGCIVHAFDPAEDRSPTVPIGRPIANMRAYVLDSGGRLLPFGVAGDLWVGGASLARGYRNQPELTADRFAPNPALDEPRLYRTGDRARLRADGTFEYLGRTDDQVKIRGVRVELGEIEAVLAGHPEIAATAAAVHERAAPPSQSEPVFCARCGLSSEFPGTAFDAEGICSQCRAFENYGKEARVYFKSMPELEAVFAQAPRREGADYDCLALLSGGKDSTYVLCRLVDMGLKPLAFTLDNGYISDQAKGNIRRVVDALGVDHVFGSTEAMNEIFVDSLQRHSNVCHGCFKTIYTLSLKLAREKKIPFIVTGLSRGQFFETRLTEDLFTQLTVSADQIDANVLESRKAYHRIDDAVHRLLDVSLFDDDSLFDEVQFVDFYRYCDVELDELMAYLDARVPWVRPSDTGRSTNCLINDVGIFVHRQERGFHNYALPYSWDVRMGHKTREAAIEELQDEIDVAAVQRILDEIGYPGDVSTLETQTRLVAYYVSDREIPAAELRRLAADRLPAAMVPSQYVRLDAIPLTANGKVDRAALRPPEAGRATVETPYLGARTDVERTLAGIWEDVLGVERVGVRDDFFELGGDSIMAIQIVARARRAGIRLALTQLFEELTVERLAATCSSEMISAEKRSGPVGLTPVQHWFFQQHPNPEQFNHVVRAKARSAVDVDALRRALARLVEHQDALRQSFERRGDEWISIVAESAGDIALRVVESRDLGEQARDATEAEWRNSFELEKPPLMRALLFTGGPDSDELVLVAHHLIVDAISWSLLLDDLSHVYEQEAAGETGALPSVTTPLGLWVEALEESAGDLAKVEYGDWAEVVGATAPAFQGDRGANSSGGPPESVSVTLPAERTKTLLGDAPRWRVGVDELLIAALARTLSEQSGSDVVRLILEGHGRESSDANLDLTSTMGWFTSMYPVAFRLPKGGTPGETVRAVKERLRRIAHRGQGYGVLRYLDPDADRRASLALRLREHVLFNYLGVVQTEPKGDQAFQLAGPMELDRGPGRRTVFGMEVNAVVAGGALTVEWTGASGWAQGNAQRFLEHVESMMDACAQGESDAVSSTDFPLAKLNDSGLGKLAALLSQKGKGG